MPPKSERLELRMDQEIIDKIDMWRGAQTDLPSRSEAIRRLIEDGLKVSDTTSLRLNRHNRLIVYMLAEILKNQHKQLGAKASPEVDPEAVDMIQEAIIGGHFWAMDWELTGILHDHAADPRKVSEVVDILDMWRFIEEDYERFSDTEKADVAKGAGYRGENPQFIGFDGTNETEHMSIARFMVQKLGRFERFKSRDFNSHSPSIDRYLRMVRIFEEVRASLVGRKMSPAEMVRILKAE